MVTEKVPPQDFPDIADIYNRYAVLTEESADLGGSLVVYAGLDWRGIAVAIAANVAGAASLGLEPDIALAKAAIRNGACDYLVNSLDEALRILKNEIRKRNPVAVALVGSPRQIVAEMVERGVQPEIVAGDVPGMGVLESRGASRLAPGAGSGEGVSWNVEQEPAQWLPVVDRLAEESLDPSEERTAARRRWIEGSPRYLGRTLYGQRYVRMSKAEAEAFSNAVRKSGVGGVVKVSRRR
jgi:hypothetical protein